MVEVLSNVIKTGKRTERHAVLTGWNTQYCLEAKYSQIDRSYCKFNLLILANNKMHSH